MSLIIAPLLEVYALHAGNAPICDPRTYHECVLTAHVHYVKDNEAAKCNCPHQCRTLIYQPTISQAQLSVSAATYMKNELKMEASVDDIIRDYCVVEVGTWEPAGFFLRLAKLGGIRDESPPAGATGGAPVGIWGRRPSILQKLTKCFENNA